MVVSERHLFNRLSGNSDNELGTALHPIVRHTFYTQGANSFKTRDKDAALVGNAALRFRDKWPA